MNQTNTYICCLLVTVGCLLLTVGCGEDRTYEYEAWTKKNHDMQAIMQEWYIEGDSIKDQEWKDYFGTTSDFFKKLIQSVNPSDTWSFCAIDSLNKDYHERGNFNHLDSYGLDYTTMQDPTKLTSQTYARILTVYDSSPAQRAGLQRGEFIGYIDGEKVTTSNVSLLKSGTEHKLIVSRLGAIGDSLIWTSEREAHLDASTKVADTQVPVMKTYARGDKMVGYIMLNHLNDDSFKSNIKEFDGADVLVVDLRLCNDGTMECAQALASCLVGSDKYGQIFCKTAYKDSKQAMNQTCQYLSDYSQYNPHVSYVWFITSSYTSGAAEWAVYGLRQTMGTDGYKVAGTASKGQNVIVREFQTEHDYTLWLSVAYVTDGADNKCAALTPDLKVNEQEYRTLYPYGNENEIVLKSILQEL